MWNRAKRAFLAIVACLELTALGAAQGGPAYLNTSLPVETRAHDLLSRLTLEEKIAQLQRHAPAIPRLGIPAYDWWNEGLHGVVHNGYATVYPQAIGLAATWDAPLLHNVAV